MRPNRLVVGEAESLDMPSPRIDVLHRALLALVLFPELGPDRYLAHTSAVVRDDSRKVGYLSEGQARTLAPILDGLDPLQVTCPLDGSKLWLDLPAPAALIKGR